MTVRGIAARPDRNGQGLNSAQLSSKDRLFVYARR
jgi:hypothetical protein